MKKFIKNNIKLYVGLIMGILICGIVVYADTLINADEVTYTPSNSNFNVFNVDEALNKLYKMTDNIDVSVKKFCELKSGTAETIGSKYECDPGDGVMRNFYILSINNDNTVDLIMENNLSDTVGENRMMNWNTAMEYFRTGDGVATKNAWTNVMNIDLPKAQAITDAVGYTTFKVANSEATWWCFGSKTQDTQSSPYCTNSNQSTYAWLFNHLIDCNQAGCTDASDATSYGYWTRDLVLNTNPARAWYVIRGGFLSGHTVSDVPNAGVRPVITILKSNLY